MLPLSKLVGAAPFIVSAMLAVALWATAKEVDELTLKLKAQTNVVALKQNELGMVTANNRHLNQTIMTLKQQLLESQQTAQRLRQYNLSIDAQLQHTLTELEKLDDAIPPTPVCELRFSDAEYERMQQFYRHTATTHRARQPQRPDVSPRRVTDRARDAVP